MPSHQLRTQVIDGVRAGALPPGTRLRRCDLAGQLGVAANTPITASGTGGYCSETRGTLRTHFPLRSEPRYAAQANGGRRRERWAADEVRVMRHLTHFS